MSLIRTFIAITLPKPIQQELDEVIRLLKNEKAGAVGWVAAKNIHLTLKFLGEVDGAKVEAISQVIQAESQPIHPFELSVGGVGAFPNLHRPRVIWVGVQAPQTLTDLANAIDQGTQRLGFQGEERVFNPHLTLGRLSQNTALKEMQAVAQALSAARIGNLGSFTVTQVTLFRSDLQSSGAVYTPLFTASLKTLG
jgi:2'-5' RNA ligase